jgi:hypothetical protein
VNDKHHKKINFKIYKYKNLIWHISQKENQTNQDKKDVKMLKKLIKELKEKKKAE